MVDYNYLTTSRIPYARFFDEVGDGTGNFDMNVDGSVTPVKFKVVCPVGSIYHVNRIIFYMEATSKITPDKWGNQDRLINGCTMNFTPSPEDGRPPFNLTPQLPFRQNADWGAYCYDINLADWGQGNSVMGARYTILKDGQHLTMRNGDELCFCINDDCRGNVATHVRCGMAAHISPFGTAANS